jgi:WD40 repeat protein
MGKKLNIILILVAFILIAGSSYILFLRSNFERTDPFNAVPDDASLIIRIRGPYFNIRPILEENNIWNEILSFPSVEKLNANFLTIDSILSNDRRAAEMVKKNELLLSFHQTGKGKFDFIAYMPMISRNNDNQLLSLVEQNTSGKSVVTERKYSGTRIFDVKSTGSKGMNFSFGFSRGLVILSPSGILLEEAFRRLDQPDAENSMPGFIQVSRTAGQNVEANIFINYKTFPAMLSMLLNEKYKENLEDFKIFANWGELDASLRDDVLLMNGFTVTDPSQNEYLNIFLKQPPQKIEIEEVIPDQAAAFIVFSIENFPAFKKKYRDYLRSNGSLEKWQSAIDDANNLYDIDLESMFYSFMDREAGILITDIKNYDRNQNTFFILKTLSEKQAEDQIMELINKAAEIEHSSSRDFIQNYRIDNETEIKIYRMPLPGLASKLLGRIFEGVKNQYCTFYDNWLIFGNSVPALGKYIHTNLLQNNLSSDIEFNKFSNFMSSQANIYLYVDISRSVDLLQSYLTGKAAKGLDENREHLMNFHSLAIQITNEGDMFYKNIFLNHFTGETYEPENVWQSHLDHTFDFKPRILINHNTQEKEIFIQDKENFIYLINSSGRILWKIKLEDQILSDIYQIDYYKNGKLQYLFNTQSKIHLIDRNGNNVEKFPITLRSTATNGIAVFDYDQNKDYRILFAAEDRQIYAYDKEGQVVKGWSPARTEQIINRPLHHVKLGDKDYIICTDNYSTYVLNRKGETRVNIKTHFPVSANNDFKFDLNSEGTYPRMAITDTSGHIHFIYFDGSSEELTCGDFSSRHFFEFADLDGNRKKEFIFTDGNELQVFNSDKKLKFSRKFKSEIIFSPVTYQFSDRDIKIGIVCPASDEIYLINKDGSTYEGFPLKGSTQFSITNFSQFSGRFNLLVGSNNNFLYNYFVK